MLYVYYTFNVTLATLSIQVQGRLDSQTTSSHGQKTNARYWNFNVIFVDGSCTRKLAQNLSSLVNNNREYRNHGLGYNN